MRNLGKSVLAAASIFGLSLAAFAQQAGAPAAATKQPVTAAEKDLVAKRQTMLRDFIHYIFINSNDMAAGLGQQLLNEKMKPTEFVDLVEGSGELSRFETVIGRAMRVPELEGTAASLLKLYERGKLDRVRNADEIKRNINLLKQGQRARILATERLVAAGEYAVPQLLEQLTGNDAELKSAAQTMLVTMGQQAVTPLCTAVTELTPANQELVVNVLGLIGYRTALPYLFDVMTHSGSDPVKRSCDRAIQKIGGAGTGDTAALYEQLGEAYYAEKPELTSFPGEIHQLLWTYDKPIGLVMTAIRTEVYHEAMAMRMAERSLAIRPGGNDDAISLWLASNFSREIQQPSEYDNPAYPKGRRDAMYYAVAAGPGPCQAVLARGLDTRNTQLSRRAIAAIEQTAGPSALLAQAGSRMPLVDALRYPNRRVQYEAALAMGKAQPQRTFPSSERVVPILGSAIRDAGARYAAIIASNKEIGNGIRKALEKSGYTVMPVSGSLADLAEPIAEAPGVDLIVTSLKADPTNSLITEAHRSAKLAATPILALTDDPQANLEMTRRYDRDVLVSVRPNGLTEAQLVEASSQLVDAAVGGPIKPDEAHDYAVRSLAVLRDLAVSGNTVFDVSAAALPLIGALGESTGGVKLDIAEVLSRIDQKRAQVALMDAALNGAGDERIALLGKTADSAKRYGNLLEPRQVERAVELAAKGSDKEATAAAALIGSLNLSNANLVPLILNKNRAG